MIVIRLDRFSNFIGYNLNTIIFKGRAKFKLDCWLEDTWVIGNFFKGVRELSDLFFYGVDFGLETCLYFLGD
jgi:hypothetical protein